MPHCRSIKRVVQCFTALAAVSVCLLFMPGAVTAQTASSGVVVGQVTDQQGKAIPGAVVVLTNAATNAAQPTVTDSQGRYAFPNLSGGTYNLDVRKDGFKEATVHNELVVVGKQLTANVQMQVGAATQTVEVTATGAELQTMNSTVGDSISGAAIVVLPNMSRDANSLTSLQPNTNPDGGVAGADSDQNSFTLDGGVNTDDMDGNHADYTGTQGGMTSGVIPVPAESVEQFTIGVQNQTADVNTGAGAAVSMQTKRGSNTFHGSAYDYYLGSRLAANDWTNNANGVPRAVSHQNRFGFSGGYKILPNFLGGPTYFYGLFEGRRFPNFATYSRPTPTATMRSGIIFANTDCTGTTSPDGNPCVNGYEAINPTSSTITVGTTAYQPSPCSGTLASGQSYAGPCDPRDPGSPLVTGSGLAATQYASGTGLNPYVAAMWKQYMPNPNQTTGGDHYNTLNYTGTLDESLYSNFFVGRVDHDFGSKNHFDATYHFFSYNPISTAQVDMGGGIPGDTLGDFKASTTRPQLPGMATAQLTTTVSSNVNNSFTYSYLRNFWQWSGSYLNPVTEQVNGSPFTPGGALEIGGETHSPLVPYNVNTQNVRTRFWDGIGHTFADNLSILHGNHLFSIGGRYTHQLDYHQRNDNGGGIMANTVYQIGYNGTTSDPILPNDFFANAGGQSGFRASSSTYQGLFNEIEGIVDQSQVMYSRAGQNLSLQQLGTPLFDKSEIPDYNVYFSDSWHVKPTLTLTYGAGYTVEMPPYEEQGKQVELVDAGDNLVSTSDYLAQREKFALGGQDYNPTLGFATVGNVGAGLKYPYHPFYGGLSPRVSLAWNPNISDGFLGSLFGGNKTVIRGGWARIYGRLNGVDLVLVPLLGTGLAQAVSCQPTFGATPGCLPQADPTQSFRIGVDGTTATLGPPPSQTLPQPYLPGMVQNGNFNPSAGAGEALDPNFRPNRSDEFDLTWQRQLASNITTELGYTGRIIRNEYQAFDLDSVPYMLTSGGQQFQQAFANLWTQIASGGTITPQPWFETALGGANNPLCTAAGSCTAYVANKYGPSGSDYIDPVSGNDVYSLWSKLESNPGWTLGRSMPSAPIATGCTPGGAVSGCPGATYNPGQVQAIFMNASLGYGNFNSMFWSVNARAWHNLTLTSNFTWSRSMGTGQVDQATSEYTVVDPWNLHAMYGPQYDDQPLQYNAYAVWTPGSKTQHGILGHLLDGWTFAPVLTWRPNGGGFFFGNATGWTDVVSGNSCDSFGEGSCSAEVNQELAVMTTKYTGGSSYFHGQNPTGVGSGAAPANGGYGLQQFSNPAAIFSEFRPMVLGIDTTAQSGRIPGLSETNVDFGVLKDLQMFEKVSIQLSGQATNVFNHFAPATQNYNINDPADFGAIYGNALSPRQVEIGAIIRW